MTNTPTPNNQADDTNCPPFVTHGEQRNYWDNNFTADENSKHERTTTKENTVVIPSI